MQGELFDLGDIYWQDSEELVWELILRMLNWGGEGRLGIYMLDREEFEIQYPFRDTWNLFLYATETDPGISNTMIAYIKNELGCLNFLDIELRNR